MTEGLLTACLGLLGAIAVAVFGAAWRFAQRLASIESRLKASEDRGDVTWKFLMRRALAEGTFAGVLSEEDGTVRAHDDAKELLRPMRPALRKFYRANRDLTPDRMFAAFEEEFGERLMREVCIPRGMSSGACVYAAIDVARGG